MNQNKEIILLAVIGISPAVITETLWALAEENPPIYPKYIDIVTTAIGKKVIEKELLEPRGKCLWEEFRNWLIKEKNIPKDSHILREIKVIVSPFLDQGKCLELEDIRNIKDNEETADYILEEVRKITENPDTQLIASVAGGRKTMGILLYSAVSMLGRKGDRITHVLVNEPYDDPRLQPKFYFPQQKEQILKTITGNIVYAKDAKIELADIPFVKFRELFPKEFGRLPGRFTDLVWQYSKEIKELYPQVGFDSQTGEMIVNEKKIKLKGKELLFFAFLWDRLEKNLPPLGCHKEVDKPFKVFAVEWKKKNQQLSHLFPEHSNFDEDDSKKCLSNLRKKLNDRGLNKFVDLIFPLRSGVGLSNSIKMKDNS